MRSLEKMRMEIRTWLSWGRTGYAALEVYS